MAWTKGNVEVGVGKGVRVRILTRDMMLSWPARWVLQFLQPTILSEFRYTLYWRPIFQGRLIWRRDVYGILVFVLDTNRSVGLDALDIADSGCLNVVG